MTNQHVVGGLPTSYSIGTPPTGSTGTLVPRATAGVYGPVLQSSSGRGRRSSPRTPGISPRGDRVSGVGRRPREDSTWIQPTTRPSSQLWTPQKQSLAMELQQLRITHQDQSRQMVEVIERSRCLEEDLAASSRYHQLSQEQSEHACNELESALSLSTGQRETEAAIKFFFKSRITSRKCLRCA